RFLSRATLVASGGGPGRRVTDRPTSSGASSQPAAAGLLGFGSFFTSAFGPGYAITLKKYPANVTHRSCCSPRSSPAGGSVNTTHTGSDGGSSTGTSQPSYRSFSPSSASAFVGSTRRTFVSFPSKRTSASRKTDPPVGELRVEGLRTRSS